MKNKKILIAVVALVAVVGLMLGIWFATRPDTVEGQKEITICIVYPDGEQKSLEYTTDAEYLVDVLLEHELVTGYSSAEYGFTIESVDGITADWDKDEAYWALYEGDQYALTSAAGIVLTDGGVYKLVYETM